MGGCATTPRKPLPFTNSSSLNFSLSCYTYTSLLASLVMVTAESHQASSDDQNNNPNMQDLDEEAETLSLCDLPIYACNASDSKEHQSLSSILQQDDHFQFFTDQEWSAGTIKTSADNIIFCGKLIPYREPISDNTQKLRSMKEQKNRKRRLFQWKPRWYNKLETSKSNVSKKKNDSKYGFSVRKVSILRSPKKSRWFLFMFGLARFDPAEVDYRDMKNRQCRRGPSTLFPSDGRGESLGVGRKGGKGLWGLIRCLGCSGAHHHENAVVKASFSCIPRV